MSFKVNNKIDIEDLNKVHGAGDDGGLPCSIGTPVVEEVTDPIDVIDPSPIPVGPTTRPSAR